MAGIAIMRGFMGQMKTSIFLNFILPLLLDLTGDLRDKLIEWAVTWYSEAQETPKIHDDILAALIIDAFQAYKAGHTLLLPGELREALYVLYWKAKATKNPLDDIIMAFLFVLFDLETPGEEGG